MKEHFWEMAYCAAVMGRSSAVGYNASQVNAEARQIADEAVKDHEERWKRIEPTANERKL